MKKTFLSLFSVGVIIATACYLSPNPQTAVASGTATLTQASNLAVVSKAAAPKWSLKPAAKLVYDKDGNCITPGSQMNDPLEPKGDRSDDAGVTDADIKSSNGGQVGLQTALDAVNKIPDAPVTTSSSDNLPFKPEGSPLMYDGSGYWGRAWGVISAAMAKVGYYEYHFDQSGHFTNWGYNIAQESTTFGIYRIEQRGNTTVLRLSFLIERNRDGSLKNTFQPNDQKFDLTHNKDDNWTFLVSPGLMQKGLRWDFHPPKGVPQSYVADDGRRFTVDGKPVGPTVGQSAASSPDLSEQSSLDHRVQAALKQQYGDNHPFNIDYWGGDDFRVHVSDDAGLAAATQWLKDHHFYHGSGKVFRA